MANLSASRACLGNSSLISMPATLVRIGFQMPRTSSAALRLHVVQIEMARAAVEPDEDGAFFRAGLVRQSSARGSRLRLGPQHVTQAQRRQAGNAKLHEAAARESVAILFGSTSIDAERHGIVSRRALGRAASALAGVGGRTGKLATRLGHHSVAKSRAAGKSVRPIHQPMLICIDTLRTGGASSGRRTFNHEARRHDGHETRRGERNQEGLSTDFVDCISLKRIDRANRGNFESPIR